MRSKPGSVTAMLLALASIGSSRPIRHLASWPAPIRNPPTRHNLCAAVLVAVALRCRRGATRRSRFLHQSYDMALRIRELCERDSELGEGRRWHDDLGAELLRLRHGCVDVVDRDVNRHIAGAPLRIGADAAADAGLRIGNHS